MGGIDASLVQLHVNKLLNLLELRLLNGGLILLVKNLRVDAVGVECDGLHGSHLHGELVAHLNVLLVQLNHRAEHVLAHVVVDLNVVALKGQVAVELHLLTGNTRTLCHSLLSLLTVDFQFLHLVEGLALGSHSGVEDALSQGNEICAVSHEVGLALQGNHSSKAVHFLHEHTTVGGLAVRALGSDGQSALAEQFLSAVEIAFSLGKCLLHIGQTSTGHSAKLFDIVN